MKKQRLIFFIPLISLVGCGSNSPKVDPIPPKSPDFENLPESIKLECGQEYNLDPLLKRRNISSNNFRFVSNNTNLVDVDNKGVVVAYSQGKTSVMVYEDENYNEIWDKAEKYTNVPVEVVESSNPVRPTHIYVNSMAEDAYIGSTYKMGAFALPNDTHQKKVKYVSTDPSVCKVDADGTVHNLRFGIAVVYAYIVGTEEGTFNPNNPTGIYNFTVFSVGYPETEYTITVPEKTVTLAVGDVYDIKPTIVPSASGLYFGYESSNKDVAIANSGKISAIFPGKATIEVRCEGAYEYIDLTVVEKESAGDSQISSIEIYDHDFALNVGEKKTLTTNIVPGTATESLTFESSNSDVVSINSVGEVTALKSGSSIIKVRSEKTKKFDQVIVTVKGQSNDTNNYYNNYYGDLTWENGVDLTNKLHDIISKDFTALAYSGSATNWETNSYADEDINDNTKVKAIYTQSSILKTNHGNGSGKWQREHAFAASLLTGLGTGPATTKPGRATDFHNLYAADASGNSSRGNKNFGYANEFDPTFNNERYYHWDKNNFEPANEDKGKVARSIFYMYVMYNHDENLEGVKESWTFKSQEDIESHSTKTKTVTFNIENHRVGIVDNYINFSRPTIDVYMAKQTNAIQYLNDIFTEKNKSISTFEVGSDEFRVETYAMMAEQYTSNCIGNLHDLIEWNTFEVDAQEIQHCESVYSHVGEAKPILNQKQGNRNPFVDYPELVNYIFGSLKNEPGSLKDLTPSVK